MAEGLTLVSGTKTISSTNTPEQLQATSQVVTGISVKASTSNADAVRIGPSTVGAASYSLLAGESIEFDIVDISNVYVYGTAARTVEFLGLVP